MARASSRTRFALGLFPLWLLALLIITVPGFMDPVFSNPPAILGLPAGLVLALIAVVWMTMGLVVLYRTSTTVSALIAFLVFTAPAAMGVVLIPASILVILNLVV